MTKLEGILRREISIDGKPFTLAISREGLTLTRKGGRKGTEPGGKGAGSRGPLEGSRERRGRGRRRPERISQWSAMTHPAVDGDAGGPDRRQWRVGGCSVGREEQLRCR